MLVKEQGGGLEVYLTRRSSRSAFMPDAYVFPGGALDDDDGSPQALARLLGSVPGLEPAYVVAGLRELFEEAGVLLVADDRGNPAVFAPERLRALRAALRDGAAFATLLAEADVWLDARDIAYYSNWITPEGEPRRFDAHFLLARAPADQIAEADAYEVHDGRWLSPRAALEAGKRGELSIQFPTRKHLERLAAYDDLDALWKHARARRVVPVAPTLEGPGGTPRFVPGTEDW